MQTKPEIDCFAGKKCAIPEELTIVDDDYVSKAEDCFFRIMTADDGDKRVVWNRLSVPEIHAAKKMFNELLTSGMVPYKVGLDGKKTSEVMQEFNPSAEEIIFVPMQAMRGG